jgi:hypothetical protein
MLFRAQMTTNKAASQARSAPATFAPPICRREPTKRPGHRANSLDTIVSSDPTKTAASRRGIAASGASHQAQRARSERSNQAQSPQPMLKTSNVAAMGTPKRVPACRAPLSKNSAGSKDSHPSPSM